MIDTILFDFDGTLADTTELILNSWQHTFRALTGKDGDEQAILDSFGETLANAMAEFFPEEDVQRGLEIYRDYQLNLTNIHWVLFPGIQDMLKELNARGMKVGIVTSRTEESTRVGLRAMGVEQEFDAIVSGDESPEAKPSAVPCQMGLAKLNSKVENTLFVGDTHFDMGCAHNAGATAVLVGWSLFLNKVKQMEGIYTPDYILSTPEDIFKVMEQC